MKLDSLFLAYPYCPAFLYPVYSDGENYYFQNNENGMITAFEPFTDHDQLEFANFISPPKDPNTDLTVNIGDMMIFAVCFPDGDIVFGHAEDIILDYRKSPQRYESYGVFFSDFKLFLERYGHEDFQK